MQFNGHTKLVGVLGYPVSHSLSPVMHNAVFTEMGINAAYLPLPTAPEHLATTIQGLRALGFAGANVTVPFKEAVIPLLDEVSPLANFLGSVNTLFWKNDKLCGTTTDPYGAINNLLDAGFGVENKHIAILGNGGVSRALAFVLCNPQYLPESTSDATSKSPLSVTLVGRDLGKLSALQQELIAANSSIIPQIELLSNFAQVSEKYDLIINGTSVGMHPNDSQSPLDKHSLLPKHIVYDIVYTPEMTQLLKDALEMGAKIVTGTGMLVHQGAYSAEFWFSSATALNRAQRVTTMKNAIELFKKSSVR